MKTNNLSTPVRILLGLTLSALGGLAFVLAFPPYEIWPLAFLGFVPVLIAQYRILPPKLSSLASSVGIYVWLQGYLGPVFAPIGTFMRWLPIIAAGLSLLTDAGQRSFNNKTGYRWFILSGIANWAGVEMIRLFIPVAGTWAFIAYPLYRQVWLIQPVSIFGIIGMGMLVMLVNYLLALILMDWLDSRWRLAEDIVRVDSRLLRGWKLAGSLVAVLWVAASLVLLNLPLGTETVDVAAIQPTVSTAANAMKDNDELAQQTLERMKTQIREAGAQFVVWPEGAFLWDPQVDDKLDLRGLTAETGAYLATGYGVFTEKGLRNEATVLSPEGEFLGVFGKDHPVVFAGETSLSRGTYPVYDTPLGKIGTIICYDLDYTDTARKVTRQGAQLIGVPSNDWSSIADKHYTHVVFRAVENRVAMVKADGSFDSAIIDPYGRILALAVNPQGGEATLVADVPLGSGKGTLTSLLGDWTGWMALAGMIFFGVAGKRLERMTTNVPPRK